MNSVLNNITKGWENPVNIRNGINKLGSIKRLLKYFADT